MARWFRFYDEALDDPKVQRLPDALFKTWVNLLCIASRNDGAIGANLAALAFQLRLSEAKVRERIQALIAAGLIDEGSDDTGFRPHNWSGRQYASDSSAERVRRYRERARNDDETLHEPLQERKSNAPDQIQSRADTEQSRTEGEGTRRKRAPTATRIPDDWQPSDALKAWAVENEPTVDASRETLKFLDYWRASSGAKARKSDWDATWRGWIRRAAEISAGQGQVNGQSGRNRTDQTELRRAGLAAAVVAIERRGPH